MKPAAWLADQPFTLALSGGFFGFFAHTGLLLALEEAGLKPRRVVGVSAGALAGGLWSSGLTAGDLACELRRVRKADFWDPSFLFLGGLLKGRKFEGLLDTLLAQVGVETLEGCATPFAAVVHDLRRRRVRVLEQGPLARAIRASCTVPLLFRPVRWERTLLVDGGLSDRTGFCAIPDGERVLYHHLLSRKRRDDPSRPPGSERGNTRVLALAGIPRVNPYHLERGRLAMAEAHERATRWLATGEA